MSSRSDNLTGEADPPELNFVGLRRLRLLWKCDRTCVGSLHAAKPPVCTHESMSFGDQRGSSSKVVVRFASGEKNLSTPQSNWPSGAW